jgi:hypothetical protein
MGAPRTATAQSRSTLSRSSLPHALTAAVHFCCKCWSALLDQRRSLLQSVCHGRSLLQVIGAPAPRCYGSCYFGRPALLPWDDKHYCQPLPWATAAAAMGGQRCSQPCVTLPPWVTGGAGMGDQVCRATKLGSVGAKHTRRCCMRMMVVVAAGSRPHWSTVLSAVCLQNSVARVAGPLLLLLQEVGCGATSPTTIIAWRSLLDDGG